MLLHIILGDFSGDGHNVTETRYVEINKDVDPQILYENYHKNVERFGFGLDDFANEYDEPSMSPDKWAVLKEHGLSPSILEDEEQPDKIWVSHNAMVAMTMFFYLYGLDDTITWEHYKIPSVPLNGFYGMNPVGAQSIGYGLFGF